MRRDVGTDQSPDACITDILDIFVVASHRRPPTITEALARLPHHVHYTTEYDVAEHVRTISPLPYDWMNDNTGPAMWCTRGHQDALRQMTKPFALVFEDDATVNRADWLDVAAKAVRMIGQIDPVTGKPLELISLHGRAMKVDPKHIWCWFGETWVKPSIGPIMRWTPDPSSPRRRRKMKTMHTRIACGSLAYVVNRETADRLIARNYDGHAYDILIANEVIGDRNNNEANERGFISCVCHPSPFNHENRNGSLINNPADDARGRR